MKDDLRYTTSDCFDTFPFPIKWQEQSCLASASATYHEFRASLMVKNEEGLTKTYNRFHDPHEHASEIMALRKLHADMDRAVLDAYGWTDLHPRLDFIPDYENESDEEIATGRERKKPWRYRWMDEDRDRFSPACLN